MRIFDNGVQRSFGDLSDTDILDLVKAVEAGTITGRETADLQTPGSIAPLKYESLDRNVKVLQNKIDEYKFWAKMPKTSVFNTVHEFLQLAQYGQRRSNAVAEGEVPKENDSLYVRRAENVKYVGETRRVSDIAMRVRTPYGNEGSGGILQREVENGILSLTQTLDFMLFNANSRIVPLEFDGLKELHKDIKYWANLETYENSPSVIDLRSAPLDEDTISDAALSIVDFGRGSMNNALLYAPPIVLTEFTKNFTTNNQKYIIPNSPAQTKGNAGQLVAGSYTQLGYVPFEYDIYIARRPARRTTDIATSLDAPQTPITPTITTVTDPLGKFFNFNGDYFYAVSAVNRFGESTLLPLSASLVSVTAAQSVNLGWTDPAPISGTEPATGYIVYRSEKNPATALADTPLYPIIEVSTTEKTAGYDGGTAGLVRDRNRIIPNTEDAFVMQFDDQVLEFAQLDTMKKVMLPQSAYLGQVFTLIQYGMQMLYAPKRVVRIQNIGRA